MKKEKIIMVMVVVKDIKKGLVNFNSSNNVEIKQNSFHEKNVEEGTNKAKQKMEHNKYQLQYYNYQKFCNYRECGDKVQLC